MQSRLFLCPPIIFPDAHPGSVEFKRISRCVGLLDEATGRSSQFLWMGLRHVEIGSLPFFLDGLRCCVDKEHEEHRCQIVALFDSHRRGDRGLLPMSFELHGDVGVELS